VPGECRFVGWSRRHGTFSRGQGACPVTHAVPDGLGRSRTTISHVDGQSPALGTSCGVAGSRCAATMARRVSTSSPWRRSRSTGSTGSWPRSRRGCVGAGIGRCLPGRLLIPKRGQAGRWRPLAIASVCDRVVQAAVKIVFEPIFEADMLPCGFGFRPKRSVHDAL